MPRYSPKDAIAIASVPTLERIRADREALPDGYSKLLVFVEENLYEPWLNVASVRHKLKIHDNSFLSGFKASAGKGLAKYIEQGRLETAYRILRDFRVPVGLVSDLVGYASHHTFSRAFSRLYGKSPSDVRDEHQRTWLDVPTLQRVGRQELSLDEAREVLGSFLELYPEVDPRTDRTEDETDEPPQVDVDGAFYERVRAEEVWERIRELPFDEQKQHVRRYRFHSTAFFDLLRETSRLLGRKDRKLGIRLAELALESVEASGEVFGERLHDHRALAWAWIGNARRLALDFLGAEKAFREAHLAWSVSRSDPNQLILAEVYYLESGLLEFQLRFAEALDLEERAIAVFKVAGSRTKLAEALLARAATTGYSGAPEDTIVDLETALDISKEEGQRFLALGVYISLALSCTLIGEYDKAAENLLKARELSNPFPDSTLKSQIELIEGLMRKGKGEIESAEESFLKAKISFTESGNSLHAAIAALELAMLCIRQGRSVDALRFSAETLPVFDTLKTYREGFAALTILQKSLKSEDLSLMMLTDIRNHLENMRLDPVINFKLKEGSGGLGS